MICDPRGGDLGDDELTWRDEVWSPVRDNQYELDTGEEVEWRSIDGEWVLKPVPEPMTVFDDHRGEPCSACETGTLEAVGCDGTTKLVCTDCETTRAEL